MPIDFEKDSEIFKALGHPVRLKMAAGLLRQECHVDKMVRRLGLPQSTVSQHLAVLRNRGIVQVRKQGVKTCYKVADKRVAALIRQFSK